ncbi:MAG: hypothetical protein HOP29_11035 [Phycisphaerales bacterium]|nr:hypothetical protein [Phycisphaerales bacterium]
MQPDDSRPPFDQERTAALVGKHFLIGLTYLDHNDKFLEQRQVHGVVVSADFKRGFAIELQGEEAGETLWLPPDLRSLQEATPGEYRLRSTGEVVVDPDFLCTWVVNKPNPTRP